MLLQRRIVIPLAIILRDEPSHRKIRLLRLCLCDSIHQIHVRRPGNIHTIQQGTHGKVIDLYADPTIRNGKGHRLDILDQDQFIHRHVDCPLQVADAVIELLRKLPKVKPDRALVAQVFRRFVRVGKACVSPGLYGQCHRAVLHCDILAACRLHGQCLFIDPG